MLLSTISVLVGLHHRTQLARLNQQPPVAMKEVIEHYNYEVALVKSRRSCTADTKVAAIPNETWKQHLSSLVCVILSTHLPTNQLCTQTHIGYHCG